MLAHLKKLIEYMRLAWRGVPLDDVSVNARSSGSRRRTQRRAAKPVQRVRMDPPIDVL